MRSQPGHGVVDPPILLLMVLIWIDITFETSRSDGHSPINSFCRRGAKCLAIRGNTEITSGSLAKPTRKMTGSVGHLSYRSEVVFPSNLTITLPAGVKGRSGQIDYLIWKAATLRRFFTLFRYQPLASLSDCHSILHDHLASY